MNALNSKSSSSLLGSRINKMLKLIKTLFMQDSFESIKFSGSCVHVQPDGAWVALYPSTRGLAPRPQAFKHTTQTSRGRNCDQDRRLWDLKNTREVR